MKSAEEIIFFLKIKDIEDKLGINVERNVKVLGLDTALKTGWCLLELDKERCKITAGTIDLRKLGKGTERLNALIRYFDKLINNKYRIIIEDTFYSFNPAMFALISRIGMIAYVVAFKKGCSLIKFIRASHARKTIGFKGNTKKAIFQEEFIKKLGIKLEDNDIIDALVLALNGIKKDIIKKLRKAKI